MKIGISTTVSIAILALIIPNAFGEEDEQKFEIIFDEGDYKLEFEEQIILPIKLHVSNHDYKIKPELFVRSQGQTVEHYTWQNLHSGNFTTYLLLDRNWSSGTYKIILKY